ncbi:hypothetical protein PHMEG_00027075 [Phytophthora megakarya]|uniref:Uncharacterized protein n=1 Tax=Phytophthora megakarya TaxID=4795 RepID=A0A225V8T3_9STRA|nr:hypothetical protein PHMEG_00027075 [Phytophthora megakarya]
MLRTTLAFWRTLVLGPAKSRIMLRTRSIMISIHKGQNVPSQIIRIFLRRMQANNAAQERLKEMLHSLKQVEGSEVLFIQDDLDITCGIVLQTRVQKLALEQ